MPVWIWGTIGGLIAASATAVGAFASMWRSESGRNPWRFMTIDFALGMMLSAAAFAMILPASEDAAVQGPWAEALTITAVIVGGVFIRLVGRVLTRVSENAVTSRSASSATLSGADSRAILFIVAMMLHNLPEGLASGAALSGLNPTQGLSLLGAIALQNVPEGLTTALAFRGLGATPRMALMGALGSALVELFGGTLGGFSLGLSPMMMPMLLGFAGGAMLTVSVGEVRERLKAWRRGKKTVVRDLAAGAFAMLAMTMMM